MQRFWLTHGSDGSQIRLEETPVWVQLLERTGEWIASKFPGHLLCCDLPEWTWDVGWGGYDPELEVWEHSLGSCSWRFLSWVEMGFGAWRKTRYITSLPVTDEWVREHFPNTDWPFENDEMESRADDPGDVIL